MINIFVLLEWCITSSLLILAVLLISLCEKVWSLPEATSKPSCAATKFSANTQRIPEGTEPVIPIQLMAPF